MTVDPEPAYGEERSLALALVNTHVETGASAVERIPDAAALDRWLAGRGIRSTPSGSGTLAQFIALRHTVRALLDACVAGRSLPDTALSHLNDAVDIPLRLILDASRAAHWETPQDAAAATVIAADVVLFLSSPDAEQVRICAADDCDRMFLQVHRRRIWCSSRCGTRMRVRRHATRSRPA